MATRFSLIFRLCDDAAKLTSNFDAHYGLMMSESAASSFVSILGFEFGYPERLRSWIDMPPEARKVITDSTDYVIGQIALSDGSSGPSREDKVRRMLVDEGVGLLHRLQEHEFYKEFFPKTDDSEYEDIIGAFCKLCLSSFAVVVHTLGDVKSSNDVLRHTLAEVVMFSSMKDGEQMVYN